MPLNCLLVDSLRDSIYTNIVYYGVFVQTFSGCLSLGCVQAQPEQGSEQPGLVAVGMEQKKIYKVPSNPNNSVIRSFHDISTL